MTLRLCPDFCLLLLVYNERNHEWSRERENVQFGGWRSEFKVSDNAETEKEVAVAQEMGSQ